LQCLWLPICVASHSVSTINGRTSHQIIACSHPHRLPSHTYAPDPPPLPHPPPHTHEVSVPTCGCPICVLRTLSNALWPNVFSEPSAKLQQEHSRKTAAATEAALV
jgi:hypothetical protein